MSDPGLVLGIVAAAAGIAFAAFERGRRVEAQLWIRAASGVLDMRAQRELVQRYADFDAARSST